MRVRILCCTAVLLLALVAGANAGNPNRIGTAGAQELTIPNSARGMALGSGMVADPNGVDNLFYNPAAIAGVTQVEAYFSNLQYIADMDKNYVAVAAKTGFGTIALTADMLSIGDIEETTEESPEGTGRVFSPNFTTLGLSYGRYMTDQVTIGATFKVISESILQLNSTGIAFDAGIQYRPGPKGVWFGLAVKNFGPNMTFEGSDFESFHQTSDNPEANERSLASLSAPFELPSYFELGVRYEYPIEEVGSLTGYGAFQSSNFNNDEFKLGAEFGYREMLYLRAGGVLTENNDYLFGPAFGAGFSLPLGAQSKLQFDYVIRTVPDYFDDNQMLAVKFIF